MSAFRRTAGNQCGWRAAVECVCRGIALLVILPTCVLAQEPEFKADVSLIEIDAEVIGKAGVIDGLGRADFAVKDNNAPVSLRYCLREQTPLDIVFLFDLSKGMAPKLDQLQVSSEMAMAELREGDRVSIASFGEQLRVELPLSSDLKEVKRRTRIGLAEVAFGDKLPSVLSAAIAAAAWLSGQPGPHQRRAILVFTLDIGTGKQESHMGAAKRLWENDVLLSAIVIPNRLTRFTHDDNPLHFGDLQRLGRLMNFSQFDSIDELAALSGGEVVYAESVGNAHGDSNPNAALREVMRRVRLRYRLYYDRPTGKPGQTRKVDLSLSSSAAALRPDARIVARKGYILPRHESR